VHSGHLSAEMSNNCWQLYTQVVDITTNSWVQTNLWRIKKKMKQ